jgi:hypothetical protein
MSSVLEESQRGKVRQAAQVALMIFVLSVLICVLTGVTACKGDDVAVAPANALTPTSVAVPTYADAGSMPPQAAEPVPVAASASAPVDFDAIHVAQLAWPWRAAAEMAAWRIKGAP